MNQNRAPARFRRLKQIGRGGMGIVYAAQDAVRGEVVALKTLPDQLVAEDLRRLKQEFRVLADVVHPNLIKIHELHFEDEECFFTMDFLDGVDFVEHVRETPSVLGRSLVRRREVVEPSPLDALATPEPPSRPFFREKALRAALAQLAEGVNAIHGYGLLHRDLKPSNVIVTTEGRVVILDFGLAQDDTAATGKFSTLSGTPSYMSPEQGRGMRATVASDWYSVGAMLYEALTGLPPFGDQFPGTVLIRKQMEDPPAPSTRARVPDDLDRLCVSLLQRNPEHRPNGREILGQLASTSSPTSIRSLKRSRAEDFLGRTAELERLRLCFKKSRQRMSVLSIVGDAGIGKSALVAECMNRWRSEHGALVFSGRCHEREHVPYKAFDGIADAIATYLDDQEAEPEQHLLPQDWGCLVMLFPALGNVQNFAPPNDLDPRELRRLAFSALIDWLRELSSSRPVVLYVDDLQWLDADSALLFQHILTSENLPKLLLIFSFRPEGERTTLVGELLRTLEGQRDIDTDHVRLGPLSYDDSRALARSVLGDQFSVVSDRIAVEAGGSPFFVWQMAHHVSQLDTLEGREDSLAIATVIQARLAMLPQEARTLLELVALTGRPARSSILSEALKPAGVDSSLDLLQRLQLLQHLPDDRVTAFHDHIRETISAQLDASEAKELHFRLARALEAANDSDFEELSRHYELGGDAANARRWLLRAAERAASTLAFSQAARLYERALAGQHDKDTDYRKLQLLWADALIRDGRSAEAAVPLLDAAKSCPSAESLKLTVRAAEQLLIAGELKRGLHAVSEVLDAVSEKLPKNARRAWAEAALIQARLRVHNLRFREIPESEIPDEVVLKLDAYKAVARSLSMVDLARSAAFDARYTLAALKLGEPKRVAIGLGTHATFISTAGVKTEPRVKQLFSTADRIVAENQDASLAAYINLCRGLCQTHFSDWRDTDRIFEGAERVFREQFSDHPWGVMFSRAMWARALAELGNWKKQSQLIRMWLGLASEQGNRYLASNLKVFYGHYHWLRRDEPAEAEAQVAEAAALWEAGEFNAQRLSASVATAQIALYMGDATRALALTQALQRQNRSSMLQFHQVSQIMIMYTLGCSALAVAEKGDSKALKLAEKQAARLLRINVSYTVGAAQLLLAGIQHVQGHPQAARAALQSASEHLERAGRSMHGAVALWQLAKLSEADEAVQYRSRAKQFFEAQEVLRPDHVARMLAPGFER